jgi:ribonuclease R
MQKAVYQPENIGHFGLGFSHYLHFTSPIRRYPDLMVHRLLRQVWQGAYRPAKAGRLKSSMQRIGKRCSEEEVNIMRAEMETIKAKQVEFLSHQIGEVFTGVISGMLPFGFFVRLDEIGAEGLVRLPTLHDDYYQADLEKHVVYGRRTGNSYRLGDKVRVQIVNVSFETREIDLLLIEGRGEDRPRRRSTRKRKRRIE